MKSIVEVLEDFLKEELLFDTLKANAVVNSLLDRFRALDLEVVIKTKLMVTAPDLLEVSKAVLKEMTHLEEINENAITFSGLTTDKLRQAIAKGEK